MNTDVQKPAVIDDVARYRWMEIQLETLFGASQILSRTLNFHETLKELLGLLDSRAGLEQGMVALKDDEGTWLNLTAFHSRRGDLPGSIRYKRGEGIIGAIFEQDGPIVLERIFDEPRFLDRLGIYDQFGSFIGVPIRLNGQIAGVLAAQPVNNRLLEERAHFMSMVANLISRNVALSLGVKLEQKELTEENDRLRRRIRSNYGLDNIIGHTPPMKRVFDQVRMVSKWDTTVLIRGESGTGKELIANAIHYNSPRVNGPFVKLNCAALTDNLIESELFGHEKGAFTGAVSSRKGRFEQADGGTLFLDEVGEVSAAFQAKLLRVLQEGEFERVGGSRTFKVDVRVIAATNRDLEKDVDAEKFREDLYYRLNVMPIFMPALRERMADIPDLASFLVKQLSDQQSRRLEVTDGAIRLLMQYEWPGNVRELQNCLERASIMSETGTIDRDVISLTGTEDRILNTRMASSSAGAEVSFDDPELDERQQVIAALEQAGWVQAKAARLLGMTPRQIAYRIQTLNIKVRKI